MVGRDQPRSSSPTYLLNHVTHDYVQTAFGSLQRGRLHNLSGQCVPVLHHPDSEEALPYVQGELPMFQFMPLPLLLLLSTTEYFLVPSSKHPPFQIFIDVISSQG